MKITRQEAINMLMTLRTNRFFRALIKKKDGGTRWMSCRLNVDAYKKGGELTYDPASLNYLVVADLKLIKELKKGEPVKSVYRTINTNTVQEIKLAGKHFEVID